MLDLSDDEKLALVALLKRAIGDDPYPLSLRVLTLKGVLAKLELPAVAAPLLRPAPAIGRGPRCVPERGAAPDEVRARPTGDPW